MIENIFRFIHYSVLSKNKFAWKLYNAETGILDEVDSRRYDIIVETTLKHYKIDVVRESYLLNQLTNYNWKQHFRSLFVVWFIMITLSSIHYTAWLLSPSNFWL